MAARMAALALIVSLGVAPPAAAQVAASDAAPVVDMEAVVVTGVQPGPGMWRATRGGHTLYVLGTQSPLPRGMEWDAAETRGVLSQAGAVLGSPGVTIDADVGFFRGLTLAPSAFKAMKNPDGHTLDQVLPPELYARWSVLKQRYLGRDRGVEKKRPLIAVYELYRAALEDNGLREGGVVGPVVDKALKQRGLERTPTMLTLKIDDPRQAIADFRNEQLKPEDLACFSGTLDIIERDLPQIVARANAWAVGDLEALRSMPNGRDQVLACLSAWTQTDTARKRGLVDIEPRVREAWLEAVDRAVDAHAVSFATVSIDQLLRADGYLADLQRRGYRIHAPDEDPEDEALEASEPSGAVTPGPAVRAPGPD
ncbi:TraB/GumN family protein [Pseudoxanthomonas sp. 10H]|uniref:TraB/GumN family protein n=1 Tax=Pseudoxanthomonas sp. 10H TaxID=3242729 RepID=UPI00355605D8